MSSSPDGRNWTNSQDINLSSNCGPSIAFSNGSLYVAFIANNSASPLQVYSTANGTSWTNYASLNQPSNCGPSIAFFKNRLYVAFTASNAGNVVQVWSTPDGVNWTNSTINQSSKSAPSLAANGNNLYLAFIANSSGNALLICSSADGTTWTNPANTNQSSRFAPSLAFFNNRLHVAFIANNAGGAVLVCSSANGTTWTNSTNTTQSSKLAPSLAVFNNCLCVAFIANSPGDALQVCSSTDGATWTNSPIINQSSKLAPSLAVAPFPNKAARYLGLIEQPQLQTEWCWAATTVSIAFLLDPASPWTQCTLANMAFKFGQTPGQPNCCVDGSNAACNLPWYPDRALTITSHLSPPPAYGTPSLQTIMNEIDSGCPVSIAIYWNGGGGHNPAIDGYDNTDEAAPTIEIQDPWYGPSTQDFNTFPASYHGGATWSVSYFTH